MMSCEELLKPVSGDKPCGEDISYDAAFVELGNRLRPKTDDIVDANYKPEEPDWKALQEDCLKLWGRSKHLQLAVYLSLTGLKTGGLAGFRESLALLKGLLEQYWEGLYPLLDETDKDPTERANIISDLAAPLGTFNDALKFMERLREAPVAVSPQLGRVTMGDVLRSETGEAGPDGKPARSAAEIQAAFRDSKPEDLAALHRATVESVELVNGASDFLIRTVGRSKAPDLGRLAEELNGIQKRLAPFAGSAAGDGENAAASGEGGAGNGGAAAGAKGISGEIQSRQDVVRTLEKICDYYKRSEPSSPVPYILKRALRLAEMDFMQIIDDMSPDSATQIRTITGEKPKAE